MRRNHLAQDALAQALAVDAYPVAVEDDQGAARCLQPRVRPLNPCALLPLPAVLVALVSAGAAVVAISRLRVPEVLGRDG